MHDPAPYADDVLERFWRQLISIAPETFIADGVNCLTVVSRNESLIADFSEGIAALAPAERELEKLL